jgi:hypothetical protein
MQDLGLEKSGLLLHEVRKKVRPGFINKYPKRDVPADVTINRAYEKYKSAKDTSAE